uniref:Protein tilB n=2 Tax=Culex pipiens TaxID=7175 RepID=A0A8D8FAL9_CULPI
MMAKYAKKGRERPGVGVGDGEKVPQRTLKLFADCGRPYSLNEAKIKFEFLDEDDRYELNLHIYKFLDTSCIEVDAQPNYIRATIKGKVFQLALKDEIKTDESTCKRSTTTGQMLIVMPKLNPQNITFSEPEVYSKVRRDAAGKTDLKGTVDYKNIIKQGGKSAEINEDEIPPLI